MEQSIAQFQANEHNNMAAESIRGARGRTSRLERHSKRQSSPLDYPATRRSTSNVRIVIWQLMPFISFVATRMRLCLHNRQDNSALKQRREKQLRQAQNVPSRGGRSQQNMPPDDDYEAAFDYFADLDERRR